MAFWCRNLTRRLPFVDIVGMAGRQHAVCGVAARPRGIRGAWQPRQHQRRVPLDYGAGIQYFPREDFVLVAGQVGRGANPR